MFRIGAKLFRAARIGGSAVSDFRLPPTRFFSINNNVNTGFKTNPVALQMINYAISLARAQKSDESYAQAQLVLEQCHSTQSDESAKGLVLLAMSTLFSERGNFGEAIEKLQKIQDLGLSSLAVRVAASEALAGLYLESYQDDFSSATADMCLQLLETIRLEIGGGGSDILEARAKALKGLVELVHGNVESAQSFFEGSQGDKGCFGKDLPCETSQMT
uniref:Binding protein n=1 Tax=Solanum tuberosum TaxID=4113 RepID=M1AH60_SOLTU